MIESYLSVRMKDNLQTNKISSKPTWLYFTAYGFILTLHIIILYPNVFTGLVISNQLFRYWRQVVAQYNQKCHPNAKNSHKTPKINQFHRSDPEVAEIGDKIARTSSPSSPTFFYLCITGPMISNQFHCSDSGDKLSPSVIRNVTQGGTCSIALTSVECWESFELFQQTIAGVEFLKVNVNLNLL